MFSFLHRLIVSLHKTSIYIIRSHGDFVLPDMLFFTLKLPAAIDLHFMNPQVAQILLKLFITGLLKKKKVSYIMYGLRVSKVTADVYFW